MGSNPQENKAATRGAADTGAAQTKPPEPHKAVGQAGPSGADAPGGQAAVEPGAYGPDAAEHAALLGEIGPLPLRGTAWPTLIKIMAWAVLILVGMQITLVATGPHRHDVSPVAAVVVLVCFLALLIVARFMLMSETRITQDGIEQSWIRPRRIAWDDILFVRYIPMLTSKRLICFSRSGRPVVFQAGTRELRAAFARIAQVYRRR
ncbi:hypothetical protein [Candidimonas nitroreducens]|uniref:hypothetical protein n=1 Tax=Candidimonas nitroreducens TaxID=683354 RepID=UPI001E63EACF|nr:hypothetical protein [Candidimonas nitroreducens]